MVKTHADEIEPEPKYCRTACNTRASSPEQVWSEQSPNNNFHNDSKNETLIPTSKSVETYAT